jgi:transposase
MEDPELTPILKELITASALPLKAVETDFSIDSSGFATSRFGRWYDHKYGKEVDKRVWYKAHLINGNNTHIVTAVEITDAYEADSNMLEPLATATSQKFNMQEFSADKAYSSRDNLAAINKLGAVPYIPFKAGTTGKPKGNDHIWRKMFNYFVYNQEDFLMHYHKRSNVETVFHMIKSKFGGQIRSKNPTACINEVLLKVLSHNICCLIQETFELGIKPEFLGVENED